MPPCAVVSWWDYAAPPPEAVLYVAVVADLIRNGKVVQIGCLAGHGRTGTFAALVRLALGLDTSAADAQKWLRTNYCSEAVESKPQEAAVVDYAKSLGIHSGDARADVGERLPPPGSGDDIKTDAGWDIRWSRSG